MRRIGRGHSALRKFCGVMNLPPPGDSSWCKYQRLKVDNKESEYEHHNTIPKAVFDVIQPIYWRLTDKQLLDKCLLGATQNANESFNNVVCSMCPKEQFCSRETVELAASLAVCLNNGAMSLIAILKEVGCTSGRFTELAMRRADFVRIRKSEG